VISLSEQQLIDRMWNRLRYFDEKNFEKRRYYEAKNRVKDLRISIPPSLRMVETVVGWPRTIVQILEERLDLQGYMNGEPYGLDTIFNANDLDVDSSMLHTDALVYGVGFAVVGRGLDGEPDPLITVESPNRMTAIWDLRSRRLSAALLIDKREDPITGKVQLPETATLYLPNENVTIGRGSSGWTEIERDVHNLGRVLVAQFTNQPESSSSKGRSEITPTIKYLTDTAMRTFLGAEVAREFYSAPQRYALGARDSYFKDEDGNDLNPWNVIMGRMLAIPYNEEDGVQPQVGQFPANSPAPYFEYIRSLAQAVAAEAAIPASYLGITTENPSSGDAIRQLESRLIKRAERRQKQFGRGWTEVARLAVLVRDGSIPVGFEDVRPMFRDPATPTRAASADEAVKLISAGVLTPDSTITYQRIGLSPIDIDTLRAEKAREESANVFERLASFSVPEPAVGETGQ
jgi:hypothetical protein